MSIVKTLDKAVDAAVATIKSEQTADPNKKLAKRFGLSLTSKQSAERDKFNVDLTHIDTFQESVGSPGFGLPNNKRRLDAQNAFREALLRGESPPLPPSDQELGQRCVWANAIVGEIRRSKSAEIKAWATPIVERFCVRVDQEIAKLEAAERATHEDWEVSHQRSGVIQKLETFKSYMRSCIAAHKLSGLFPYLGQ